MILSETLMRAATSVVFVPLVLLSVAMGGAWWQGLMVVFFMIAVCEWAHMWLGRHVGFHMWPLIWFLALVWMGAVLGFLLDVLYISSLLDMINLGFGVFVIFVSLSVVHVVSLVFGLLVLSLSSARIELFLKGVLKPGDVELRVVMSPWRWLVFFAVPLILCLWNNALAVLVPCLFCMAFGIFLFLRAHPKHAFVGAFWGGTLYLGLSFFSLLMLYDTLGPAWIVWMLCVTWATDVGAYFAGRHFGGPLVFPVISPKKTWSGVLGGMLSGLIVGLTGYLWALDTAWLFGAILSLAASLCVIFGDVLESGCKRMFGVKDSGVMIPGHGGVLDRLDGLFGVAILLMMLSGYLSAP